MGLVLRTSRYICYDIENKLDPYSRGKNYILVTYIDSELLIPYLFTEIKKNNSCLKNTYSVWHLISNVMYVCIFIIAENYRILFTDSSTHGDYSPFDSFVPWDTPLLWNICEQNQSYYEAILVPSISKV